MTMSRCGKRYATFDLAYAAADQRTYKTGKAWKVASCSLGEHWHVVWPELVLAVRKPVKLDPFPPLIARLIDKRDEGRCQRCGRTGRLERHHRRAKGSGGSKARAHTQCPCNALSLCRRCHAWAHEHPADARHYGWIVLQSVAEPRLVEVLRDAGREDHEPDKFWATCDGRWVHSPLETED